VQFRALKELLTGDNSNNISLIKAKPKKHITETERGSKYRGVSKNGKKWQVSIFSTLLTVF
jgi:hypothetical protein